MTWVISTDSYCITLLTAERLRDHFWSRHRLCKLISRVNVVDFSFVE